MNSKFGVFSLFALFPLACAYFNIQNCAEPRYSWVEGGLRDAVYLAGSEASRVVAPGIGKQRSSSQGVGGREEGRKGR